MSSASVTTSFDSKVNESFIRFVRKNIRDLRIYRHAINNFVVTNLRMRYRRSTLGFLWTLLNPLMVMIVLSVVFSLIFQRDIRTFSVYIFSGMAPWGFINGAIQHGAQSIILSEGYLKKVYLPKVMFPIIYVSSEAVNFVFSLLSLYLLALMLGSPVTWKLALLPFAVLITYLFVLGMAMILSVATVYFRDLTQIVSVLFTALFYAVPIVYPLELIPEQFQMYFKWNPFYYFITMFRHAIVGSEVMTLLDWAVPLAIAVLTCLVGFYVLMKRDRDIIYRL